MNTESVVRMQRKMCELQEELAQERKRLDWALTAGAEYKYGTLSWANKYLMPAQAETDDPKGLIDILIAESQK